jgi:hypothetical protein
MTEFIHAIPTVRLRGGPLPEDYGYHPRIGELGHELRITLIAREGDRVFLRELFYNVIGYEDIDAPTPVLVADYAATQDTELPRVT